MLRPAKRVTNRRWLIRTGCPNECIRYLVEERRRNSANLLHHFRRVARKMATQRLKNAARMLQGQIAFRETEIGMPFVGPARFVVGAPFLLPAGKESSRAFIRVAKIFAQNAGGIREMDDVVAEEKIILDNVADDSPEERNVAAGTHRHPYVGQRARPRKSRIDMNDGGAALLCLHHPAETDRVGFGHR